MHLHPQYTNQQEHIGDDSAIFAKILDEELRESIQSLDWESDSDWELTDSGMSQSSSKRNESASQNKAGEQESTKMKSTSGSVPK